MARGDGALGSLTEDQFGSLSKGFDMSNPIGSLGGISKGSVPGYALGIANIAGLSTGPIGFANTAIDTYGKYSAEKAAQSALGIDRGFIDTVTGMVTNPAMDTARSMADTNKDGKVSTREAQNFGMQQTNLTAYNVGLNPMAGYTPNTVSIQGLTPFGKTDPDAGLGGINTSNQVADVMTQQQVDDMFSGIDTTSGVTGLGGGKGGSYMGITNFSPTQGVDTDDPNSTGSTGVSVSNQSYSDDAQSSGTGGGGTYICTALYEMGDMKKSIYKYDQIYGKKVDPATYRGYELWGKYVASKLRNRGIVYKVAKPIALTWANQMAYDLSKGKIGKNSLAIKITKTIGEGCCYILGQIFKRRTLWLKST